MKTDENTEVELHLIACDEFVETHIPENNFNGGSYKQQHYCSGKRQHCKHKF